MSACRACCGPQGTRSHPALKNIAAFAIMNARAIVAQPSHLQYARQHAQCAGLPGSGAKEPRGLRHHQHAHQAGRQRHVHGCSQWTAGGRPAGESSLGLLRTLLVEAAPTSLAEPLLLRLRSALTGHQANGTAAAGAPRGVASPSSNGASRATQTGDTKDSAFASDRGSRLMERYHRLREEKPKKPRRSSRGKLQTGQGRQGRRGDPTAGSSRAALEDPALPAEPPRRQQGSQKRKGLPSCFVLHQSQAAPPPLLQPLHPLTPR